MTFKKTKLVLGVTTALFALAAATVSTEAAAKKTTKKHSHSTKSKTVTPSFKAESMATRSIEVAPVAPVAAPYDDSALKARIAELEGRPAPVAAARTKDDMVFFRGGYAHANRTRNGVSINSNALGGTVGGLADKDAWYFGAGLDFSLDDNLFGLANNTEVLAEIMFEYKEFNDKVGGNYVATNLTPTVGANGAGSLGVSNITGARDVTVSQFSLTASPKIKFLKGQDFRPWIIPAGFAMNVISPPSESITVLQPAMMFGLGADYRVWKNIYVGADARYQQNIGRTLDGVQTNGFTAGGYLGIGF
jgi:opacity protein-like surface antigen